MEELYNSLYNQGLYTGTFEKFQSDYSGENYQELYNKLNDNDYYTGSFDQFNTDYDPNITEKKETTTTDEKLTFDEEDKEVEFDGNVFSYAYNNAVDLVSDLGRSWEQGQIQGARTDEGIELLKGNNTDEEITRWVEGQQKQERLNRQSAEMKSFDKIYEEAGGGMWGFLKGVAYNPTTLSTMLVSSVSSQIRSLASDEVAYAATAGAGAGTAVAGPIGTIGGTMIGSMIGMEAGLTFNELLMEEIGGNLNDPGAKEKVKKIIEDPEKLKSLQLKSLGRGITIGGVEALTLGVARGVAAKLAKYSLFGAGAAAGTTEVIGGGLGEVAGRAVAGQEMDAKEIGFEAFAGLGSAPVSLGSALSSFKTAQQTSAINNKIRQTKDQTGYTNISDAFKNETSKDGENLGFKITETDIEISKFSNSEKILNREVNEKIKEGEFTQEEGNEIKENFIKTQSAVNRIKSLNLNTVQETETTNKLIELDKLEQTVKEVKNSALTQTQQARIDEINLEFSNLFTEKDIAFAEDAAQSLGIEVQVLDVEKRPEDQKIIDEVFVDKEGKKVSGVEGSYSSKNNKIYIDKVEAAKKAKVTVGSHELLHGILANAAKIDNKILEDFKKQLSANQIGVVNKKLTDNYDTEYIENNPDEFITQFSDAIAAGEISYNENLFTKLGDLITPIFRAVGFSKIKFDTGRNVYNFMREYSKSMDQGQISRDILQAVNTQKQDKDNKFSKTESNRIDDLVGPKTDGKYTMTKAQWDAGGLNAAYNDLILGTGLDALIGKGIFGSEVQGVSRDQFKQNVKDRLTDELLKFNPEVNNSLSGFINSRLAFRKGDELKKLKKTKAASIDDETSSGKSFVSNIADTTVAPETATTKTPVSKLRRIVGTDVASGKEVARTILKGKLPATTDRKIKSAINKRAREEYLDDVKALIDDAFLEEKAVDIINALSIQDVVKLERGSKDKILAKIVAKNIGPIAVDKAIAQGKLPKETNRTSGPNLYERLPVDKTQLIEFLKPRKIAFAGVIAENLAKDAIPGVMSEPDTQQRRRNVEKAQGRKTDETDKVKVSSAIDRDPTIKFSKSFPDLTKKQINTAVELTELIEKSDIDNFYDGKGNLLPEYKSKYKSVGNIVYELFNEPGGLNTEEAARFKTAIKNSTKIPKSLKELFEKQGTFRFNKKSKEVLAKDSKTISQALGEGAMNVLGYDVFGFYNRALNPAQKIVDKEASKKAGKRIYQENVSGEYFQYLEAIKKAVKGKNSKISNEVLSAVRKMNKAFILFKKIDKIFKLNTSKEKKLEQLEKLNPEIEAANKANIELANEVVKTINKLYKENKISGLSVLNILQLQTNATGGLRALSTLDFVTLEDGPQTYKTKGEHLAPNSNTMFKLAEAVLDKDLNLEESNTFIEAALLDHAQWYTSDALTQVVDKKGGKNNKSNAARIKFLDNKDINNVFDIEGRSYRVNEIIEKAEKKSADFNNKKLPVSVKFSKSQDYTNKMVLDEMAELDKQETEAQIKFSKSIDLNKDFNDIIEKKTGIGTDKRYAKVKAQVAGASKGKFKFFIPPSAEDFVGLLYATLSKGKLGDAQMAWYKQNLLDPYAKAMNSISSDRISLMNDLKELKKLLKVIPKDLRSKVPGEAFTKEQAVRVYIWNSQDMSVPGLSKNDLKDLTDFVEQNENLKIFAEEVIQINKGEQYAPPDLGWVAGKIDTDLLKGLNTTRRSQYLKPWQDNVDVIFSEENLNKLEAAYGENYRIALEGILKRMKSGRNRPFADNSITGRVTDWLSNSVGAIMFFNTRSAVLQLLSTVNFVNFTDNNILKAGQAFANQPQYWKDVLNLMNSDFLKERRGGLRINVNEADIADMAKKSGARGVISRILQLGFAPTQIADSLAISLGGATFYRNRIKTLKKQGLTDKEAQDQAFVDFREVAEEAQQSSRPDRISEQQAGPLGRIILAFANTPAQYARIIKKAALDLKNSRGDAKTNLSKIIYYTFAQNFIFNALQQALFALSFGDDDDEKVDEKTKQKYFNIINSMSDSILRGIGIGGAVFSVIKNAIIKLSQQAEKPNPKYSKTLLNEALKISPPLSSKASKLTGIGWSLEKQQQEIKEKGFSLDNPAYLAVGRAISFTTNIPADRALIKINNLAQSTRDDITTLERLALIGGWQDWELGIKKQDNTKVKSSSKRRVVKKKKSNKKRKF